MDGVHLFKREGSYVYELPEPWRLDGFHTRITMTLVGAALMFRIEHERRMVTDDSMLQASDVKWVQIPYAYDTVLETQLPNEDMRTLFCALRAGELRGDFEAQAVGSLYWSLVVEDVLEHGFLERCLPKARAFYDKAMNENPSPQEAKDGC